MRFTLLSRKKFRSYRAVNTVRLGYKNRNLDLYTEIINRCLFWYSNKVRTRQTMYVRRNIEAHSCNHFCSGKAISSLVSSIQRACVILSLVALSALQYFFFTLSHKRQYFRKKTLLNIKCVFRCSLQILSETFLILRRNERDMIKNVNWSSCTVNFILYRF